MRYTQIQRKHNDFITVKEYIKYTQLDTYNKLRKTFKRYKNITEQVTAAAELTEKDKKYARIMQERPKPGKGGILPGEKEEQK